MRAGAATVHELSGGRMLLGLGSSHRDTVSEVRGHEYRGPLSAMRDYLAAYEAARLPRPRAPRPARRWCWPRLRPRMLALAATATDGAFPYLVPDCLRGRRPRAPRRGGGGSRASRARCWSSACACLLQTDALAARAAARRYLDRYLGCRTTSPTCARRASRTTSSPNPAPTAWSTRWWRGATTTRCAPACEPCSTPARTRWR